MIADNNDGMKVRAKLTLLHINIYSLVTIAYKCKYILELILIIHIVQCWFE